VHVFDIVAFVANGSLCTCVGNIRQKHSIEESCHKDKECQDLTAFVVWSDQSSNVAPDAVCSNLMQWNQRYHPHRNSSNCRHIILLPL
jgi:hypothetical protein